MTKEAVEQAIVVREEAGHTDSIWLRISVRGGGCSGFSYGMKFDDYVDEHDVKFDFETEFDLLNVAIDSRSFMYLKGTTVDFQSGLMGKGFSYNNPNAKTKCGCGSSFGA